MEPGYKMLGSTGTQYLNPDYIQPLPTTLDSKNSPLALLAQTCSSIGKESNSSSSKLSLPSLNDKKESSHHRDVTVKEGGTACKMRPSEESPVGLRTGNSETTRMNRSSKEISSRSNSSGGAGGDSSPKSRERNSSMRPVSSHVSSLGSGSGKCTPSSVSSFTVNNSSSSSSSIQHSNSRDSAMTSASSVNKSIHRDSSSLIYDNYADEVEKAGGLSSTFLQQHNLQEVLRLQHESLQSLQASSLGPLPSGYSQFLFGHPLATIDPLMYSYSASLAAVHGLAMNSHKLPMLSPYMGYPRVSTASGGLSLMCKDPYCSTGALPLHLQSSACGAGCTQCGSSAASGQDKSHQCTPSTSLACTNDIRAQLSSLYPLSLPGGLASPLLGMAAHLRVGLAQYPCNWLSGGEFCGKRFSKADELLQHLKTHTTSGDPPFPSLPLPTPAGFVGNSGHPFAIPGSLSPSSILQQTAQPYPRSLSPNSLLTARYHPYKSPFAAVLPTSSVAAGTALTGTGSSALEAAYYSSPYALYSKRINAAAVGP